MPEEGQGSADNQSDNNGAPNGAVSESDLIALKKSHVTEVNKLNTKVTKLTSDMEAMTTAKAAVEAELAKSAELQTQLDASNAELKTAKTTLTEARIQLSTSRRSSLMERHGLKEDTLKDMNDDQLDALEKVLPTVSNKVPNPNNLDAGGGPSNPPSELSARGNIAAALGSEK